jgi:hypothetical protein
MLDEILKNLQGMGASLAKVPGAALEDIKRAPEHGRAFLARLLGTGTPAPEQEFGNLAFGPPGTQNAALVGMKRLAPETRKLVHDALGRMTESERAWLTGPKTKVAVSELGTLSPESRGTAKLIEYGSHAQTGLTPARAAVRLDPGRGPAALAPAMVEEELRHAYEAMRAVQNPEARQAAIALYNQPEMAHVVNMYKSQGRPPKHILREIAANAHRGTLSGPGAPTQNYFDALYGAALESPKVRDLYVDLLGKIRPPGFTPPLAQ